MDRFVTLSEQNNIRLAQFSDTDRILLEGIQTIQNIDDLLKHNIPDGEIRLYHPYLFSQKEKVSFMQLLLDERYSYGYLSIPAKILRECGFLNERLPKKNIYELILRVARKYTIIGMPADAETEEKNIYDCTEQGYQVDCYIAGKYCRFLQDNGKFQTVLETLVRQAEQSGTEKGRRLEYLEDMLGRKKRFQWFEEGAAPVLIYYGVTYCYNVMNVMLEQLAVALEKKGIVVIRYNEQKEDIVGLGKYVGQTFRAVIGMQTYLFSVYIKKTKRFLHDDIKGPKFNFVLDHPFWLKNQLMHVAGQCYVLTHDENYKKFVEKYYPEVRETYILPPGGIQQKRKIDWVNRKYEVSFIGTFGDYREKCKLIHQSERNVRFLANHLLGYMKKNPEFTAEEALEKTLSAYHISLPKNQFLEMMYQMGTVVQCIMYYYREKVVRTLADAGVQLHIWGSSWKKSNLEFYDNVIVHEDVSWKESLEIYGQSKVSLNVMAWHKGGFTERMANSMLAGTLLLTDMTSYDPVHMSDGRECMTYSLNELEILPGKVKCILQDDSKRITIAQNGYEYAIQKHTWDTRAEELLKITDSLSEEL